ncbi:MAG: penicillin-insensitive murein endopeptidase, partial [Gemmobacter sp.]|nr:penicillin-insensitive murein endopeptidase [Gemmobacter sp.]
MFSRIVTIIALCAGLTSPAVAQDKANKLFGAMRSASAHAPTAIGSYAKGCGAGFEQLPESGPTWQAMRLSRNRNWGHPEMIAFVKDLSVEATRIGWSGIYVGDISQPRGGPMTSGHASHQIGLDADIWMLPGRKMNMNRAEREKISSAIVRTSNQRGVTKAWTAS